MQREQPLRLELRHLDFGARAAAQKPPLVLEVRANAHLPVRDLMRRKRAGLPFRNVLRVDQVLPDLVHGLGDLDGKLETDHRGVGR